MRVLILFLIPISAVCTVRAFPIRTMTDRVGRYLGHSDPPEPVVPGIRSRDASGPRLLWVACGAVVGVLVAQGDLFLTGPGRSVVGLGLLGGAGGWFLRSAYETNLHESRLRRLREELPIVVDALSLHVVSGESVVSAVQHVADEVDGVVASELRALVDGAATDGFDVAVAAASHASEVDDARRLYDLLAHAHAVGGRLSDSLQELSSDLRAGLERQLTTEGGKRAIATYGPVLALMVPTALVFLLYPTILGLRTLAGVP